MQPPPKLLRRAMKNLKRMVKNQKKMMKNLKRMMKNRKKMTKNRKRWMINRKVEATKTRIARVASHLRMTRIKTETAMIVTERDDGAEIEDLDHVKEEDQDHHVIDQEKTNPADGDVVLDPLTEQDPRNELLLPTKTKRKPEEKGKLHPDSVMSIHLHRTLVRRSLKRR